MKKLNMIILLGLTVLFLFPSFVRAGDCEKLGKAVEKLKTEADNLDGEADNLKGEVENAEADLTTAERNLANYLNNPTAHGPADQVRRRAKELRDALKKAQDNLRKKQSEYFDKLEELRKKTKELLEKLEERKRKCTDEKKDDEIPGIEQDLRENKDKPGRIQEKQEKMVDDEAAKYESELEKEEGESEQDYQRRLTELWKDLLKKKMGKQEKYWKDDFWQKVLDKIIEKIKQKLKESEERTGGASQGALPRDNNREREYIFDEPRFAGGFIAGLPAPYELPDHFTPSMMEELQRAVFENPETLEKLFESLGGEFFFGEFSGPCQFRDEQQHSGFMYGIQGSANLTGHFDLTARASGWQQRHSATFPVQVMDPGKGESRSMNGKLTQNSRIFSLDAILRRRFGNGRLQPFAGAGFSFYRSRIQPMTAELGGVSWQVGNGGNSTGTSFLAQGGARFLFSPHIGISGELNARLGKEGVRLGGVMGVAFGF